MPSVKDLVDLLGLAAVSLQTAAPGVPGRVWQDLGPWLERLSMNATKRWLPRMMQSTPCQVPMYSHGEVVGECTQYAVAQCDVCGKQSCLQHCRVDQYGDAICYLCCMEAVQARRAREQHDHAHDAVDQGGRAYWGPKGAPPPPTPESQAAALRAAYRLLHVSRKATDEELRQALRAELGKSHPDHQRTPADKARAEKRFKEIQDAFRIIETSRKGQAA
jgi:hypothetical protein